MKRLYRATSFKPATLNVIEQANIIAEDYAKQGLSLTLRQLYYRFVARGWIANRQTEYKRLGSIINDARYAGLFDWSLITDRTRNANGGDFGSRPGHPEDTIDPDYYTVTHWDGQTERVEVWVEKDALIDVIQQASRGLRAVTFSCRGYTSSSEVWAAAQRIEEKLDEPGVEHVTILHLGDHDPSGIDMTRDITDRLKEFLRGDGYLPSSSLSIKRIALNMDQIQQYDPPPNPAKETDSRFSGYRERFGDESWELDSLEPRTLIDLIKREIRPFIDDTKWQVRRKIATEGQTTLAAVKEHYVDIIEYLRQNDWLPEVTDGVDPDLEDADDAFPDDLVDPDAE